MFKKGDRVRYKDGEEVIGSNVVARQKGEEVWYEDGKYDYESGLELIGETRTEQPKQEIRMPQFKVGDRVEVSRKESVLNYQLEVGEVGLITRVIDRDDPAYSLIFRNGSMSQTCSESNDCIRLVQDTSQTPQVGDTVTSRKSPENSYEISSIENNHVYYVAGGQDRLDTLLQHYHLTKGAAKTITGYELLKDLPGVKAGALYTPESGTTTMFNANGNSQHQRVHLDTVKNTEWFKPVYKPTSIDIKFSNYSAKLSRESLIFGDGESLPFAELVRLLEVLYVKENTVRAGSFDVVIDREVRRVRVGCKSFNKEDIKLITDAITKL